MTQLENPITILFVMDPPTGLRPMVWRDGKPEGMPTIYKLLEKLVKDGHEVHFLSIINHDEQAKIIGDDGYLPASGIHSHLLNLPQWQLPSFRIPRRISGPLSYLPPLLKAMLSLWKLIGIIGKINPDLVYSGKEYQFIGSVSGKIRRVPTIARFYGVHTLYESMVKRRAFFEYPKEFLAMKLPADQIIITNDGSQGDKVARRYGVPEQRLNFWINGIDDTMYQSEFDRDIFLEQLGIPRDSKVILTLCRLVDWKKVDKVIQAIPEVVEKVEDAIFLIVGDGPERANLERLVHDLGIGRHVKFIGAIPHAQVSGFMNAADIFASVHDLANLPVPILEAMSSGKCIVSLDDGALDGLIENGKSGILIEPASVDAELPRVLVSLLCDDSKRMELGSKAREFAVNNLETWESRISKEIELINEVALNSKRKKRHA